MTLEEHARAIEAAIQAAAEDGLYLDDTDGGTPALDLNDWSRKPMQWAGIDIPQR